MAALWTEDNTIGNALSQAFGNSGARGPAMYKMGVETRTLLDQQQAEEDYIRAQAARIKAQEPPPYMPPSATGIPWEGPPTPEMQKERSTFDLNREAAIATMKLGARNPANMPAIYKGSAAGQALSDISLYGVPSDPREVLKQDVQLRGSYPDVALTPKDQFTESKIKERWANLQATAAQRELTTVEQRDAQILSGLINKSKTNVGAHGVVTQDEYNWSAPEQNLLRKAGVLPPIGQQALPGAAPQQQPGGVATPQTQPLPSPLQAAPVTGAPGAMTVTPDAPRPPPQPGEIIDGYQFVSGDWRDQNNWRPAPPQGAAAPAVAAPAAAAAAGAAQVVRGPSGQAISIQPLPGDPKGSTEAQAKNARAVDRAEGIRQALETTVGLQRDAKGIPIGFTNKYIPGRMAATVSRTMGDTEIGRDVANYLDEQGRPPGTSKMQEYAILTDQWIEEVVRLVSGATVLPAERSSYRAMYMPNASDTDKSAMMKFELMRNWALSTSTAATPADAIAQMRAAVSGNPTLKAQIDAMEAKAKAAGTLNKRYDQIGQ